MLLLTSCQITRLPLPADAQSNIAYQPGTIMGMGGPRLDWVVSEAMSPGAISFTADPQLGKAVIVANSWEEMCDRGAEYFATRGPVIQGTASTYAQTMHNLFASSRFRAGTIASNETFSAIDIPEHPTRGIRNVLQDQVGRGGCDRTVRCPLPRVMHAAPAN